MDAQIPESLIKELSKWYESVEGNQSFKSWEAPGMGGHVDLQSCSKSKTAYLKGCNSLRVAKSLQRMLRSLSNVVDDRVRSLKKAVLPTSRSYGLRKLPNELTVRIIELVGFQLWDDPRKLTATFQGFFDIPHFDAAVKDAKVLATRCMSSDDIVFRGLPLSRYPKEVFLTDDYWDSISRVRQGLVDFKDLQRLELSAAFNYEPLRRELMDDDLSVLPELKWLKLDNRQSHSSPEELERLSMFLPHFSMPKLRHLVAILKDDEEGDDTRTDPIRDILSDPLFDCIETLDLAVVDVRSRIYEAHMYIVVAAMPNMSTLRLRSCQRVRYIFPSDMPSWQSPKPLLSLRLDYDDDQPEDSSSAATDPRATLQDLQVLHKYSLKEVIISTRQDAIYEAALSEFPGALRVTNRSILDEWDD